MDDKIEIKQGKSKLKRLVLFPQTVLESIQKKPKPYLITFWVFVLLVFLTYNLLYRLAGFTITTDPPLGFYTFTGIYCPACGGTRMTHNFLIFNWWRAFVFNPFFFILYVFTLGYIGVLSVQIFTGKKILKLNIGIIIVAWAIVIIIFTILRNFVPVLAI